MSEYQISANYQFWLTALALCMIGLIAGVVGLVVPVLGHNCWYRRSKVLLLLGMLSLLLKDAMSLLKDGDDRIAALGWFAAVSAGFLIIQGIARQARDQRPRTLAVWLLFTAAAASFWFVQRVNLKDQFEFTHRGVIKSRPAASMAHWMSVDGLCTDKGNPVLASRVTDQDPVSSGLAEDRSFAHLWPHILQIGSPSLRTNCHGWVFTLGEFVVLPEYVLPILDDNGYGLVDDPRPGDLIVYRTSRDGVVTHTGVVKMVEYGRILIESKWGRHGCYLHEPKHSIYADWSRHYYYRSARPGHLLRGLDEVLRGRTLEKRTGQHEPRFSTAHEVQGLASGSATP